MQTGRIYQGASKDGTGNWMLRFWETVQGPDGQRKRRRACVKLADYGGKYKTAESVRGLAGVYLAPVNARTAPVESVMTVADFYEHVFLVERAPQLRPSTAQLYGEVFRQVKPLLGAITLRDFTTPDACRILKALSRKPNGELRAHGVIKTRKSALSAVFTYAVQTGRITHNPIRDAELPKGKPTDTYAYSHDEVKLMLKTLKGTARTLVATAAFSGLRISEIRGLRWEDIREDAIFVGRSIWNGKIGETKNDASNAPVPLLKTLKVELDAHRKRNPGTTWVFTNRFSRPSRTNYLTLQIRDALACIGIGWFGWHAFRRGLATNLHDAGVDDLTTAAILRHADVSTTRRCYVKRLPRQSVKAMQKLAKAFGD
jgi:integrase